MAIPLNRRWTDPRDGTEWELIYEPGVEEDEPEVRSFREGIRFRSGDDELKVPAVFGADLHTLTDRDLEGLLDQAREAATRRARRRSAPLL